MSIQWTIIASFLYGEIFLTMIFLLPFISATRWRSIFKSRIMSAFTSYANLYFGIFLCMLFIMFLDGIREIRKYSTPLKSEDIAHSPGAEASHNMKLFRAQRNFYISGFSLFLFIVLRRLVVLINHLGTTQTDLDATKRQAESATAAAKRFIDGKDAQDTINKESAKSVDENMKNTERKIQQLTDELAKSKTDLNVMKKQSEATNREYDALMQQVASLQDELKKSKGASGTKKAD